MFTALRIASLPSSFFNFDNAFVTFLTIQKHVTFGLQTKIPIAAPTAVAQALIRAEQKRINVLFYPRFWQMIMLIIRLIPEFIFKRLSL